jgi:hypothetical protein
MKRRIIILSILTLLMMVAAVGCGKNQQQPGNTTPPAGMVAADPGPKAPSAVPHAREGQENCLMCHNNLRDIQLHPTGGIDQCIQCHVFKDLD